MFRYQVKKVLLKVPVVSKIIKDRVYRTFTEQQKLIVDTIDFKSMVIDVGANVGVYSELFSSKGANVIAFEPNSFAYDVLIKKEIPRVLALNYVADTEKSEKKLFHHKFSERDEVDYSESSSFLEDKPNVSRKNYSLIRTIDLAAFILLFPRKINLLKIDIEGYEVKLVPYLLVMGALENVDYCFIETHEKKFKELREETKKMITLISASQTHCKVFFDWH